MTTFMLACVVGTAAVAVIADAEPNPPVWPDSVRVFSPTDTDIQAAVNAAYAANGGHVPPNHGQFSSKRFAFLFRPGTYTADVPVGFYTTIHGLGASPDDVVFAGEKGVYAEEGNYNATGGALCNFWRGAENFRSSATFKWVTGTGMLWAVSQAAPLRRLHVDETLVLYEYERPYQAAGYASGGFLADAILEKGYTAGSQQQWFSRNVDIKGGSAAPTLAIWNSVYVGCTGAVPPAHCGNANESRSTVVVTSTPEIAEKPFITVAAAGGKGFSLIVPAMRTDASGPSFQTEQASTDPTIDFSNVYVARASVDTAASINAKLAAAHIQAVVITPGIYKLSEPLKLVADGTVLLGLGLATLVPTGSFAAVEVSAAKSRVAGLLLQAGSGGGASPGTLLYIAPAGTGTIVQDVFARVGGPDTVPVSASVMMQVDADGVIGDDMWLWRADHTVGGEVYHADNPVHHGLVVNGDDVTMYGLAVEHTLNDLVVWNGERGRTYFYQSELPYDVTQAQFGDPGYAGYRVADGVTQHAGYGIGVYHFFRDYAITVPTGIVAPSTATFVSPVVVYLNGLGKVNHVLNDKGEPTGNGTAGHQAYVC